LFHKTAGFICEWEDENDVIEWEIGEGTVGFESASVGYDGTSAIVMIGYRFRYENYRYNEDDRCFSSDYTITRTKSLTDVGEDPEKITAKVTEMYEKVTGETPRNQPELLTVNILFKG